MKSVPQRTAATVVALGLLAVAGCSSSSSSTKSDSPKPTSSAPHTSVPVQTASASPTSSTPSGKPLLKTTKVTSAGTTIAFTSAFVKALYKHGINTTPTGRAGLDDTHRAHLPVSSGSATLYAGTRDLARNTATLQHKGSGLIVSNKKVRVTIGSVVLTLGAHPSISVLLSISTKGSDTAKGSGAERVPLFDLSLTRGATHNSDGTTLAGMRAVLDPEAARNLDKAFGTKIYSAYGKKVVGAVSITIDS